MTIQTGELHIVETLDDFRDQLDADVLEIATACVESDISELTKKKLIAKARENADKMDGDAVEDTTEGEPRLEDIHSGLLYEFVWNDHGDAIRATLDAREKAYMYPRSDEQKHYIIELDSE